jgi:hypothetical protein
MTGRTFSLRQTSRRRRGVGVLAFSTTDPAQTCHTGTALHHFTVLEWEKLTGHRQGGGRDARGELVVHSADRAWGVHPCAPVAPRRTLRSRPLAPASSNNKTAGSALREPLSSMAEARLPVPSSLPARAIRCSPNRPEQAEKGARYVFSPNTSNVIWCPLSFKRITHLGETRTRGRRPTPIGTVSPFQHSQSANGEVVLNGTDAPGVVPAIGTWPGAYECGATRCAASPGGRGAPRAGRV